MELSIDKTFDKVNYKENPLPRGEYEHCRFSNCDFAGSDLSGSTFMDCTFTDCNISLVTLTKTAFRDTRFKDCKMLGLRFDHCNQFGMSFQFEKCVLNHCSFYGTKIKKTIIKNSLLQESDFTDCDLSAAVIDNCDLTRATFENTLLEKADLRRSYNYSIDPERNRIKKAKFSLTEIGGLLDKYNIEIDRAH